jgi:hypothetical protein
MWKLWIPLRFENQHVDVCVQEFSKIMPCLLHFFIRGDSDNVGCSDRDRTRPEAYSIIGALFMKKNT